METFNFRAMNSNILLAAEGMPFQLAKGFELARQFIEAGEARFSRFLEGSELSQLNGNAGTWFQASPDLFRVVAQAKEFFHRTGGLFDPSILPDLRRVGYDRSMDLMRTQGATPLDPSAPQPIRISLDEMNLDEAEQKILLPPGMTLDLGGIAKGWIAEQAALVLAEYSSPCAVNAGGDLFVAGLPQDEKVWPVALEDPLDPRSDLTTFKIGSGALATSAVTKRSWKQGEIQRHHLIDPRTGEPAISDWLSVTALAPHAAQAEVYAKALLIAGPGQAEQLIHDSQSQIFYLAVDHDKNISGNLPRREFSYVR
jgi:thiamine biosynthesis lipoprotein